MPPPGRSAFDALDHVAANAGDALDHGVRRSAVLGVRPGPGPGPGKSELDHCLAQETCVATHPDSLPPGELSALDGQEDRGVVVRKAKESVTTARVMASSPPAADRSAGSHIGLQPATTEPTRLAPAHPATGSLVTNPASSRLDDTATGFVDTGQPVRRSPARGVGRQLDSNRSILIRRGAAPRPPVVPTVGVVGKAYGGTDFGPDAARSSTRTPSLPHGHAAFPHGGPGRHPPSVRAATPLPIGRPNAPRRRSRTLRRLLVATFADLMPPHAAASLTPRSARIASRSAKRSRFAASSKSVAASADSPGAGVPRSTLCSNS